MSGYDEDGGTPTAHLLSETRPRARKQHKCSHCEHPIEPSQIYRRCFLLIDGEEPWTEKTCQRCEAGEHGVELAEAGVASDALKALEWEVNRP